MQEIPKWEKEYTQSVTQEGSERKRKRKMMRIVFRANVWKSWAISTIQIPKPFILFYFYIHSTDVIRHLVYCIAWNGFWKFLLNVWIFSFFDSFRFVFFLHSPLSCSWLMIMYAMQCNRILFDMKPFGIFKFQEDSLKSQSRVFKMNEK